MSDMKMPGEMNHMKILQRAVTDDAVLMVQGGALGRAACVLGHVIDDAALRSHRRMTGQGKREQYEMPIAIGKRNGTTCMPENATGIMVHVGPAALARHVLRF